MNIHDWGMEFTAGGGLIQSELLLISRRPAAMAHYLPKLERCANFIESRRDPKNNLFWAGAAGNLLAPSFAGCKKPDGTYGMAYLTGLSVTYIAFLDRLVELEKLAGNSSQARLYADRRATARQGLDRLTTDEGYLIKSMDPDGSRHGVYGAAKYGYFEASPNHDAICFRIVDQAQSLRIYQKIASIPGLRPYGLILANCPSLDDMYEAPQGLWGFGTWVNGGHWTTCEARMMMAYYRVGQYADARRAMEQMLTFARKFRMDNPLVKFGSDVYQPGEPVNLTYDAFGAPAGFIRGLFEYLYRADGLTLVPHIPPGIPHLEQNFPVRFGDKRLYLAVTGTGPITSVEINGQPWLAFDAQTVSLRYEPLPDTAAVQIIRGSAQPRAWKAPEPSGSLPAVPALAAWRAPDPVEVISTNELSVRIGADSNGGSRFLGDIARPSLFRRALSADEIGTLGKSPNAFAQDAAMVAQWIFEKTDNGTVPNASGTAPAAKIVGNVKTVDSPFGKALHLTGEGYLEIPNSPELALTRGGTWFALIRSGKTNGRLIDKCPVGGNAGYTFDTYPGNALRLITDAGSISIDAKLPLDDWVAVAATVDAHGNSALYINGKQVTTAKRSAGEVELKSLLAKAERLRAFVADMEKAGLDGSYETAHARLAVRCLASAYEHAEGVRSGKLVRLPGRSQAAADRLYLSTAAKLSEGLEKVLNAYASSDDARRRQIHGLWHKSN